MGLRFRVLSEAGHPLPVRTSIFTFGVLVAWNLNAPVGEGPSPIPGRECARSIRVPSWKPAGVGDNPVIGKVASETREATRGCCLGAGDLPLGENAEPSNLKEEEH